MELHSMKIIEENNKCSFQTGKQHYTDNKFKKLNWLMEEL